MPHPTMTRQVGNRIEPVVAEKLSYGNNQSIVDYILMQKARARGERDRLERRWFLNIAYFVGHQYMQWDPHRKALRLPHAPKHRIRIVVNRLMPLVRRIIASTLKQRPQWVVQPATDEVEDIITAGLTRNRLKERWRTLNMNKKIVEILKWRSTCSDVFFRAYWDPFAGEHFVMDAADVADRIPRDEEQRKLYSKKEGKRLKKSGLFGPDDTEKKTIFLGDSAVDIASPFRIWPDPDALSIEECSHLIDATEKPVPWVTERYGISAKDLGADKSGEAPTKFRQLRGLSGSSNDDLQSGGGSGQGGNLIELNTLWMRPTRDEPTGWWAVEAGGKILRKERNKPGFPTFPWHHAQEINIPGSFFGTCAMEQSIPIQVAYNRQRSQIIEHSNVLSRPPWLIPKGSGARNIDFNGEPGSLLRYTWPMKPEMAQVRDLPSTSHQNIHQLIGDLEDVSSQHEASRGIAPGRVESGVGLAQLQEQDEGILTPASTETADAVAALGADITKIDSQMVTEDRLIKVMGENNAFTVNTFKGKDLIGQNSGRAGVNYFDIEVSMGVGQSASPAQRKQEAFQMAQFGIFNPQIKEQREQLLELMDWRKDPSKLTGGQLDRNNQMRETQFMIATGQTIPIAPWDEDEIHVKVIRDYQKTPEYMEKISEAGGFESPIHQSIEQHLGLHVERMQMRIQAATVPPQQEPQPEQQQQGGPAPGAEEALL